MRISDWSSDVCSSDLFVLKRLSTASQRRDALRAHGPVTAAHLGDPAAFTGCTIGIGERQGPDFVRSEEHTSELQSPMRLSFAVFCLKQNYALHIHIPYYEPLPTYQFNHHLLIK